MADLLQVYAHRYGIPLKLARALVGQESGGSASAVSPKGATGLTQVMPGTAAGMYGISPAEAARRLKDPAFALDAGFRYLAEQKKAFGTWSLALAAYNAGPGAVSKYGGIPPYQETQNYVRSILGKAGVLSDPTPSPTGLPAAPKLTSQVNLDALRKASAFSGLQHMAAGNYDPQKALAGMLSLQQVQYGSAAAKKALGPQGQPQPTMIDSPTGPWKKWVISGSGMDRSGVTTKAGVLQFVAKIAQIAGRPLTIGTGTNHNEFVAGTQRQSDHWFGDAADIPASGAALTRLGQETLIAAGMPRAQALKATGGVYNVNGFNILFNTNIGGNHWNHVHVGLGRILGRK